MRVGDKVIVVDFLETYSTYEECIEKNCSAEQYKKWRNIKLNNLGKQTLYDGVHPINNEIGTIVKIAFHDYNKKEVLIVENETNIFIINKEGVKLL